MSEAVGIHAHPTKKLGTRPEDLTRPKVSIDSFLWRTGLPVYPEIDEQPSYSYPMDHNDSVGDCVDAGGDHVCEVVLTALTGSYVNWTDDQLLKAYQSQNPGFKSWADAGGPDDNGMVIAEFLDYGIKQGWWLAYGKLDTTNEASLKAAIDIGLGIVTGEDLTVAQQEGSVWDYVEGSAAWGGHCTVWTGYSAQGYETVSWGADSYVMTPAFVAKQVTEAYFVLFQAHVDHPGFRDNFNLAEFADAVSQLTKGKVVVPTPTPPTPTPPTPTPPTPTPPTDYAVSAEVATRIERIAAKKHETGDAWLEHHLTEYFKLIGLFDSDV